MKVTAWLTRKVGPLPMWAWPVVAVGSFVAYRYLKSKQAANAATSGTAVPIGGSPFNFPDYSQPDAGMLLPTSSTGTTTPTTPSSGGSGTSTNTTTGIDPATGLQYGTLQDAVALGGGPYLAALYAQQHPGTPASTPAPNYYSPTAGRIPTSAMTTTNSGPGGERRA